jgi:hypothetical protein
MKRTAFALGLLALFASTSASAIKVPTGSTDYDLNISVLLQGRFEETSKATTEKTLDTDIFMRRARLAAGGTAFKVFSFFVQYDNSNLGKRQATGVSNINTATNPGFVQDAIIGWTPIPDFTIETGLILQPSLRTLAYNSSGGQVQIAAPADFFFDNVSRGFRMMGAQVRGFLGPVHLIHYRAGIWEGFHNTTAVTGAAPVPTINPGGKPLIGGHLRVNIIGDETGYGLNQMYLDGKPRASVGGVIQYQPKAACSNNGAAGAASACSISTGQGVAAVVNDYKMYGADAFVDLPVGPDLELAASGAIIRWDYGSTAVAGTTGYQRTGTGFTGEVDLRVGAIAPYVSFYEYSADSGTTNKTADRRKYAAGLAFFLKGHQSKINVEWNSITPGIESNPGSISPVASAVGLKGPATNSIWVQAQAAF